MGRNSAERHPIPDIARDAGTPFHVIMAGLDPALHAAVPQHVGWVERPVRRSA
jgi:hypothetical protein